ncbi:MULTISPECIES: hypothetical protein [Sphingomonas]|uniref:hypothetical protein n=1 Tax=Sphingomonas TaxID=13687 RepID=UPI0013E02A7E|nr:MULTISPECIES: hypothetical protein [Sphingomonas]
MATLSVCACAIVGKTMQAATAIMEAERDHIVERDTLFMSPPLPTLFVGNRFCCERPDAFATAVSLPSVATLSMFETRSCPTGLILSAGVFSMLQPVISFHPCNKLASFIAAQQAVGLKRVTSAAAGRAALFRAR